MRHRYTDLNTMFTPLLKGSMVMTFSIQVHRGLSRVDPIQAVGQPACGAQWPFIVQLGLRSLLREQPHTDAGHQATIHTDTVTLRNMLNQGEANRAGRSRLQALENRTASRNFWTAYSPVSPAFVSVPLAFACLDSPLTLQNKATLLSAVQNL